MQLSLIILKCIHQSVSRLLLLFSWKIREKKTGEEEGRGAAKENVSWCEFECRSDWIPPNATTVFLMFNWGCENKTGIYMRGLELRGELNGNAERMWQSYHENARTAEHQAYIWFNPKWYGSNPYARSKKQKRRRQEQHSQVISHGHHSQTLPRGAGLGNNNQE